MSDVKISVGMLENGSVITIDEYDKFLYEKVVFCPHCRNGSKVFGRKGKIRKHSFAHFAGEGKGCNASPRNDLHVLVQDEIASGASIALPDFIYSLPGVSTLSSQSFDIINLSDCRKEARYPSHGNVSQCSIDVEGTMPNGVRLLVEVTVSHETSDPDALLARSALFRPCADFRCTDLVDTDWNRDTIKKALLDSSRWSWLQIPVMQGSAHGLFLYVHAHPDGDFLVRFTSWNKKGHYRIVHSDGGLKGFDAAGYGRCDNGFPLNRLKRENLSDLEERSGFTAVNALTHEAKGSFTANVPLFKSSRYGMFSYLPEQWKFKYDPLLIELKKKFPSLSKKNIISRNFDLLI